MTCQYLSIFDLYQLAHEAGGAIDPQGIFTVSLESDIFYQPAPLTRPQIIARSLGCTLPVSQGRKGDLDTDSATVCSSDIYQSFLSLQNSHPFAKGGQPDFNNRSGWAFS